MDFFWYFRVSLNKIQYSKWKLNQAQYLSVILFGPILLSLRFYFDGKSGNNAFSFVSLSLLFFLLNAKSLKCFHVFHQWARKKKTIICWLAASTTFAFSVRQKKKKKYWNLYFNFHLLLSQFAIPSAPWRSQIDGGLVSLQVMDAYKIMKSKYFKRTHDFIWTKTENFTATKSRFRDFFKILLFHVASMSKFKFILSAILSM